MVAFYLIDMFHRLPEAHLSKMPLLFKILYMWPLNLFFPDDSGDEEPTSQSDRSEIQGTLKILVSKLDDLSTCNDLIAKHGAALQRSLSELEGLKVPVEGGEKIKAVNERATLFRITSNAMINVSICDRPSYMMQRLSVARSVWQECRSSIKLWLESDERWYHFIVWHVKLERVSCRPVGCRFREASPDPWPDPYFLNITVSKLGLCLKNMYTNEAVKGSVHPLINIFYLPPCWRWSFGDHKTFLQP